MIYIIPTKRGLGAEIWGTYQDLSDFYDFIGKFWNDEQYTEVKGFANRDMLISGFSYEIRKAKEASRQQRTTSHYSLEPIKHYGVKISWVHFLFSLTAIKFNMRYYEVNKLDISMMLQIEYWLKTAMQNYDEIGAKKLSGFIEDGLYDANEYIYHYMRNINTDYFLLWGGKKAFRMLPELLKCGVFFSDEYKDFQKQLEQDAKSLECDINDLELNDEHIDFDKIKW